MKHNFLHCKHKFISNEFLSNVFVMCDPLPVKHLRTTHLTMGCLHVYNANTRATIL